VLVSNQIGNVLSVEHDIDYDRLEVSSPGLDRVLRKEADFVRFTGERVQVKLRVPMENRKNFIGILRGFANAELAIEVDGVMHNVALSNVDKARLSPQF
jgi:ribosome maturation factor RimP